MDASQITRKLRSLKFYLSKLPSKLPLADPDASANKLIQFALDESWVEDIGEENTVNRALEAALQDFLPRNNEGLFRIQYRGPGIVSLGHVLETLIHKYPKSFLLQKWLRDALNSVIESFTECDELIPVLGASATATESEGTETRSAAAAIVASQPEAESQGTTKPRKTKDTAKGPKRQTKVLDSINDPNYSDSDESDDERTGGRKILPLLRQVSKPARRRNNPERKVARCVGSVGCNSSWAWPRNRTRILDHASRCGYIANLPGGRDLVAGALNELGSKCPGVVQRAADVVKRSSDLKRACPDDDDDGVQEISPPKPPKRHKTAESGLSQSGNKKAGSKPMEGRKDGRKEMEVYKTEGRKVLEEDGNAALVEMIVGCGLPPNLLTKASFARFIVAIKSKYQLPKRDKFERDLLPAHAASLHVASLDFLKTRRNLNISFDGGKLIRKKFYSVHVTTPDRLSFCLELDDVAKLSQSGDYICELLRKWILEIGPYRFCNVTSDNASNCAKARRITVNEFPYIFNLADACHNLHNCCKDICALDEFKPIISKLRALLAFMILSSYSLDYFDEARSNLRISRGLQTIGDTRFGTIYWSINSVLEGFPAFKKVVEESHETGVEGEIIDELFGDEDRAYVFKRDLTRLCVLLMPIARAIQCLESRDITPGDVFLYWLAVVAQFKDIISRDDNLPESKYNTAVKEKIRAIVNSRYKQLIEVESAQNIYLVAFMLDPLHRNAVIFSQHDPNPLATPSISLTKGNKNQGHSSSVKKASPLQEKVRIGLQKILAREFGNQYREGRSITYGNP